MNHYKTIQDAITFFDKKYNLTDVEAIMEGETVRIRIGFRNNKKISLKRNGLLMLTINGKVKETVTFKEDMYSKDLYEAKDMYINHLVKEVHQGLFRHLRASGINIPISARFL